jgi:hypothetical protein
MPDVDGGPGGHVWEKPASGGDSGHVHREPVTVAGASAPLGSLTRYAIGGFSISAGGVTPNRGPVGVLPKQPASVEPGELVRDVLRGVGAPLDPVVREEMSSRFGTDFSAVRVHADAGARRSAAAIGARAYTAGDHIVTGAAALDRRTLAHELVHVMQQRLLPAAGGRGLRVGDATDLSERAADAGAHEALSGDGAPPHVHAPVHAPVGGEGLLVQRQIDDAALPDAVLGPAADLDQLCAYLDSVVDTENGLTFRKVVTETLTEFPEESEAASLTWLWYWVQHFCVPARAGVVHPRTIRADLIELAEGINGVHAAIRDDVLGRARGMHADARAAQTKVPLTAPNLSRKTDILEKWIQSGDHNLPAPDLAAVRRLLEGLAPEISAHRGRGRLVETNTRMGFEIETGNHLAVTPKFVDMAEGLLNVTLATTDRVEFLIDDIKSYERGAIVQVEFRTRPFTRNVVRNAVELKKKIDEDISNFPLKSFGTDAATVSAALTEQGWAGSPQLDRLAPGLMAVEKSAEPARIQHVTHSIPLARFVRLKAAQKNLLIPGTGQVTTVEQLLTFFLMEKIVPQTKNGTVVVTTIGRNAHTPNVKSGLDTISGFLPPDRFDELATTKAFTDLPKEVRIRVPGGKDHTGDIGPLTRHEEIPRFPSFTVAQGRAHLSSEEKLAPVLFDTTLKDLRVLVEHRADALVTAVNDAMSGNPAKLGEYLDVFRLLDDPKAPDLKDDRTFGHWFT